ncbi:MAG: hypothetical protein P4L84_07520 [Isosphaeraceae bacterium]|nr:hypothetical protein [Isosphaeraceae bacterium]
MSVGSPFNASFVRVTARLLLVTLFLIGLVRAVRYGIYVFIRVQNPFDAQYLESAMVHFAWRVQHGVSLYPDWEHYPYVANFYAPLSFVIIGMIGRALGTNIHGLYVIGRSVSVVSVLATTLVVGFVLKRRYGALPALFGMLLTLGVCPQFGPGVMTRPDALADCLGLTGFLLAGGRRRTTATAGALVLYLAAMTKQTALVYLAAAALGLCIEGRTRRSLTLLLAVASALLVTVLVVRWAIEPNFVRCLLGESTTPFRFHCWWSTVRDVASIDPEFFVLSAAGVALWSTGPRREPGLAALAVLLLAASVLTAAKCGSGTNYFLGVSSVAALAGGALWSEMTLPNSRPKVWQLLAATAVGGGLLLSTKASGAYAQLAHLDRMLSTSKETVDLHHRLYRTAENPSSHLLTDDGMIDIHQGERTVFADPYRFKLMVETGQINPARLRQMIADSHYELIITSKDLFADDYSSYDFGLPGVLAKEARLHYEPVGQLYGRFFYSKRAQSSPH